MKLNHLEALHLLKLLLSAISFVSYLLFNPPDTFALTVSSPQNVPSQVFIGDSFNVLTTISGVSTGEKYYVKCRVGLSSSSLTEGQTFNLSSNAWLSDNSAWTSMPVVDVSDQSITFPIRCRLKEGSSTGQKLVYARVCLKKSDGSCTSSIQSATGTTLTAIGSTTTSPPSSTTQPTSSSTSPPATTPQSSPTSVRSSFTISPITNQISSTDLMTVPVSLILPASPNSKFYLKGAFKKVDSGNYFGFTQLGNSWINNGTSYSKQFPIITDSIGHWSGNLVVKVDSSDSGFTGSGEYIFKVARYSQSGSGPTWSNEVTVAVTATTTDSADKNSSTADNSSSKSLSSSPKTSLPKKSNSTSQTLTANIKGLATSSGLATPSATPKSLVKSNSPQINWWLIGGGIISLGVAIFLLVKAFRNR